MCIAVKYKTDTALKTYTLEYCSGDCTTKDAQLFIKQAFIAALNSSSAYSTHCQNFTGCGVNNISVECSQVTRRKRDTRSVKRNCTHNVQITFDLFIKLRSWVVLKANKLSADIRRVFKKMSEDIRQSIDSGQLDLAVTGLPMQVKPDSLEKVDYHSRLLCPPGSLPRKSTFTCRKSMTTKHSDNSLFRPVYCSVLLS